MGLSKEQTTIIVALRLTSSVLTILGCLFIIFSVVKFKKLRSLPTRLIFWLACSSLITGLVNLLTPLRNIPPICFAQGLIMQFSQQATFLWTCVIATNIFLALVVRYKYMSRTEKYYHCFVWTYAVGFALCPVFTYDYGPAGPWCWITDSTIGQIWRFACFYIPLAFYLIYVATLYVIIVCVLRYTFTRIKTKTKEQRARDWRIINRLIAYPIIFFVLWAFPMTNRIYGLLTDGGEVFWLVLTSSTLAASQGFCNAVAYGLDSELRRRYKRMLCGRCYNDDGEEESRIDNTGDMSKTVQQRQEFHKKEKKHHPKSKKADISHARNLSYLFEWMFLCKSAHERFYPDV